jgi:hypothetical protein
MKRLLPALALLLLAVPALAQVTAEHVAPAKDLDLEPGTDTLKLTISLGGDDKRLSILALEPNRTRIFKETAEHFLQTTQTDEDDDGGTKTIETTVEKTRVTEVKIGKRIGKKKREELVIGAMLETESIRQKVNVRFALVGGGREAWSWSDHIVLGMTGADIAMGGALAAGAAQKAKPVDIAIPLTDELKAALAEVPELVIYLTLLD